MSHNLDKGINWRRCIICQAVTDKQGPIILEPRVESYSILLKSIQERSSLFVGDDVNIKERLQDITPTLLMKENAIWHRCCYSNTTHKTNIRRARERKENVLPNESCASKRLGRKRKITEINEHFTRLSTIPFAKHLCFFCQKDELNQKLFSVQTENAGKTLQNALAISRDPVLKTRLNNGTSTDTQALGVFYHKSCWTSNVFHVLRTENEKTNSKKNDTWQTATLIELINLVASRTQNKEYLSMEYIENTYVNMLGGKNSLSNNTQPFSRRWLKEKILAYLPTVISTKQKDRTKPCLLYSPGACNVDMAVKLEGEDIKMKTIYKAATLVRQGIKDLMKKEKTNTNTNTNTNLAVNCNKDEIPPELFSLIQWVMVGPSPLGETGKRSTRLEQQILTVTQNILFGFKTDRQMQFKAKTDSFRQSNNKDNSQTLGLALTVHHETRNKKLIELLCAQNYSVSYSRTLRLETSIANAVIENTKAHQGLYVPPFLKKGTFLFFAADNTDFAEDTADGKGTTHGTIITVFQKAEAGGETISPPLSIKETDNLTVDSYNVPLMPCEKPAPKPQNRTTQFKYNESDISKAYQLPHLGWILATVLSRTKLGDNQSSQIPSWSGYNSLLSESRSITEVGVLPLLPAVAHEWSTLLTVITQAKRLKDLTVGNNYPTLISFDMALYEKIIKLLDARPVLKKEVVPRLGELHVVMASFRALGTSIENSGIDDAWIESGVYGPATTRQILSCSHYKRCVRAHVYSYIALYEMALEVFFNEHPDLKDTFAGMTNKLEEGFFEKNHTDRVFLVKEAHGNLQKTMEEENLLHCLDEWKKQKSKNAMFRALMNYLKRVESILFFIAASRTADFDLHLEAGEALSKYFFALDRTKYKRLWPRYIADMHDLKKAHPNAYQELKEGNISVTKSSIPFVSLGADHACEQENRRMKVHSGLIGISNNMNARQRFFLALPELSRISSQFKRQKILAENSSKFHHNLSKSAIRRDHSAIDKIKIAMQSHGNPFAITGDRLYNLTTLAYIPDEYVPTILNVDNVGQRLYETYVADRINGETSLWSPIKKVNNKMYLSGNKKITIKLRDENIDLKETKDLYARLMILAKSNRDIDQKHAIGNYEFTLTPRSLFAANGTLLACVGKSKLIHSLQNLTPKDVPQSTTPETMKNIAVVDGMVVVQKLASTTEPMATVKDLSDIFNLRLLSLTDGFEEIILVFDTYKKNSLKGGTRELRRQGKQPTQYHIKDETSIKHITLKTFLSHEQTKDDLTKYLAEKVVQYNARSAKNVIVSAGGKTISNCGLKFADNNHEEADTLMIHQASLAQQRHPHSKLIIFSPDTDVLVLAIGHYNKLPKETSISMVSGLIEVRNIWPILGEDKAIALPGFHAFTGCDTTGRFCNIGKATWFNSFLGCDDDAIEAFQMLSGPSVLSEKHCSSLAAFVCMAYSPKGVYIKSIPELRWYLFCRNMAESYRLPPTEAALKQHIQRAHVQARIWGQACSANQDFLDPLEHGYCKDRSGEITPTTTDSLPAPKAIIEMVKCNCKTDCLSNRCSCQANNLVCTDLCGCDRNELCQNDDSNSTCILSDESESDSE